MSSVISHIQTDHRNKLCIVRLQPYSSRGRDMKKLAALQTLAFLLNSETVIDVKYCIHSNADANKDKELTNSLEVSLCHFLLAIKLLNCLLLQSVSEKLQDSVFNTYTNLLQAGWKHYNLFCSDKTIEVN